MKIDFKRLEKLNVSIASKKNRIGHLDDLRTSVTGRLKEVNVQGGGAVGDKIAELTAQILDLEKELLAEVAELESERSKAEAILFDVCTMMEYDVMISLFMLNEPAQEIADRLAVSRQRIYQIRNNVFERLTEN